MLTFKPAQSADEIDACLIWNADYLPLLPFTFRWVSRCEMTALIQQKAQGGSGLAPGCATNKQKALVCVQRVTAFPSKSHHRRTFVSLPCDWSDDCLLFGWWEEKENLFSEITQSAVCMPLYCGEVLGCDFWSLAKRHIIINVSSLLCLYPYKSLLLLGNHALSAGTVTNVFSFFFFLLSGSWLKWCSVIHSSSHCWELVTLKVSRILPPVGPDPPDSSCHGFSHSRSKNGIAPLPPLTGE